MKLALILLSCLSMGANAAELSGSHTVYLLPMSNGLDQFIANRLVAAKAFTVVTDAQKADLIFTDRIGPVLEDRLTELFPPPTPPTPAADTATEKDKDKDSQSEGPGDTVNKLEKVGSMSVLARSKGNIFLVDVKSRDVLWSTFQQSSGSAAEDLDRTATKIVDQLSKSLKQPRNKSLKQPSKKSAK